MGFSRSRKITLSVALGALTFNVLSSLFISQLSDDRFHFAERFGWYLHFMSVACIFGIIGALRHHALSISLFANFILLDTLFTTLPRLLLPVLLPSISALCAAPLFEPRPFSSTQDVQQLSIPPQLSSANSHSLSSFARPTFRAQLEDLAATWTPEGCEKIVKLGQVTLAAMIVAAMVLQIWGAVRVKMYAKRLGREEMTERTELREVEISGQSEKGV